MSFPVYRELFAVYMQWLLFMLANFMFTAVRNMSWVLNGTYWRLLQNQKPENYEQCAQVMNVLCKLHIDQFVEPSLCDYFLVHERFESPEFLLRDDVTLLNITDSHAIFVQDRKSAAPPYLHNFLILGQWDSVDKVITIPLNQFNRLAESVKHDGAKIIFLQNQSRCGGTLLTNVFLETGRCITFNEPGVVNALCKYIYITPIWGREEEKRIFRNTIYMLCKPYHGLKDVPLAYVIKPTVTSIASIELVQEYMPEACQIFLYREPTHVAISLSRLAEVLHSLKLLFHMPNLPGTVAPLMRFIGHTEVDLRGWYPRCHRRLEIGYRMACISMHHYLKNRDAGVKINAMRYRDLVNHRDSMIHQLFEVCQLPTDMVVDALQAMDKDSQEHTKFSRKKLAKAVPNPPKVTSAFLEAARDMARQFGVKGPDGWDESVRLPGSIIPQI